MERSCITDGKPPHPVSPALPQPGSILQTQGPLCPDEDAVRRAVMGPVAQPGARAAGHSAWLPEDACAWLVPQAFVEWSL